MKSSVVTIKFNDEDFVGEVVSVSGKHCLAKICGQTVFCHVNDSAAIFAGKHAPQYRDERMPLPTVGKKILVRVIEDPDHAGKWKGEVWGSYKEYESAVALIKNRSENPRAMKPCVPPVPKTPAKPYVPPVPKTPAMPERKPESAEKSEASASVRAVSSEGNAKDERRQGFAQRRHGGYRHHHGDHFRGKRHQYVRKDDSFRGRHQESEPPVDPLSIVGELERAVAEDEAVLSRADDVFIDQALAQGQSGTTGSATADCTIAFSSSVSKAEDAERVEG